MIPEQNPAKKIWQEPQLQIISQNNVTGGGPNNAYYEKDVKSSSPYNVAGFQYRFKFNGGGSGLAHHKISYYHS